MYRILNHLATATFAVAVAVGTCTAQVSDTELAAHPEYTESNALPYPEPGKSVKYTKAPAGYKPFYMSHYGRHGSRFHHSADEYRYLAETLAKADSAGALTATGKQISALAQVLKSEAMPRTGDLTQAGVHQHMGIAKRMAKNFPEIFRTRKSAGKKVVPHVKAYASTSGRCIVSMAAFIGEFRVQFPEIEPELLSGKSYMPFICAFDWSKLDYSKAPAYTAESDKLWQKVDPKPLMRKLFADTAYAAKNIDAGTFYNRLLEITDLFPGMDSALVASVEKAAGAPVDSALASSTPVAATLRFGHDAGLLTLAALMQLPVANAKVSDLSKLHEQWTDFRVIPMAANLQIVFYRKGDAPAKAGTTPDVLVKVLYNEIEQALPVPCAPGIKCPAAPYYRWEDFRNFYSQLAK